MEVRMAEPTLGADQLLPYERVAASDAEAGGGFDDLASVILDEAPTDTEDATPEADEVEGEPEEAEEVEAATEEESDEDADANDEDAGAPPSLYKLKANGVEEEVTLEELVRRASMGTDYTRKTTEVANQRRALEAERAESAQLRDKYAARLGAVEKLLTEQAPPAPDEALRQANPGEYAAQALEVEQHNRRLAALRAEQDTIRAQQEREFHEKLATIRQTESELLLAAIPEWKDEAKAQPEKAALVEYASSLGMDESYLDAVTDHRFVVLLRKARLYDQMQTKGKQAIQEKVATAQVLKPGGRPQTTHKAKRTEVQRMAERLERTGRVDDAAALFEHLFEG